MKAKPQFFFLEGGGGAEETFLEGGRGGGCFKVFLQLIFFGLFLHKFACSYFYARGQLNWNIVAILEVGQGGTRRHPYRIL